MASEQYAVYWRDAEGRARGLPMWVAEGADIYAAARLELLYRGVQDAKVVAAEPLSRARMEKRTFMHATGGSAYDFFEQRAAFLAQREQDEAAHLEQRVTEALGRVSKRSTPFMEYTRRQQLAAAKAEEVNARKAPPALEVPEVPWPFNVVNDVEPPNNTPRGLMVVSAIGYRMGNTWSPQ